MDGIYKLVTNDNDLVYYKKKVDIVSLIKEIYNPEEINNVEIEKFENKKTFTGKIGLNFQYKKVDNDLGRNTVTTHQVKIVSNQRLKYINSFFLF